MKKFLTILTVMATMLACSKENNIAPDSETSGSNIVKITVDALKVAPEVDSEEAGTKLGYDWSANTFGWESGDKLQIMLCKWQDESHSAAWSKNVVIDPLPGAPGVFEGEIDLSNPESEDNPFVYTDIHGVVVVKEAKSDWLIRRVSISGNVSMAISIPGIVNQTQAEAGVFTSGTTFPFYSGIPVDGNGVPSAEYLTQDSEGIHLKNIQLVSGCCIWEYHVYADADGGTDPGYASEKIQSITTTVNGNNLAAIHANYLYWNETSNTARRGYSASNICTSSVTLGAAASLPAARADAAVIWHHVAAGTAKPLVGIVVKTDKATYYKTFDGSKSVSAAKATVYPLYINLANCERVAVGEFQYSKDGGSTWTDEVPSSFSTLAVKSEGGRSLSQGVLLGLRTAIDKQSSAVALDLSRLDYESDTFPAVFGNATAAALASAKIKSVVFPSNVKGLAANAFYNCTKFETIDLTGFTTLGNSCLCNTGIVDITVPTSVTSLGTYVLANNTKLASVYWACQDPVMANFGTSNRKDYYTLAMANSDTAPTADLVVTIAKNTYIPRYFFRYNNNLKKLIFEAGNKRRIGNNAFQNTRYLKEIEIYGTAPASFPWGTSDVYNANIAAHVDAADRKIIFKQVSVATATAQTASDTFYVGGGFFNKLVTSLKFNLEGVTE